MKEKIMEYFVIYILAISFLSVIVCCYDKLSAKRQKRRISEKTLLWLSALGGSVAMYFTMRIIRHKTLHNKFMIGLPVMILFQVALVIVLYYKFL
jgi:uncharacterized membrane protein YsdA (DUF1294 family)